MKWVTSPRSSRTGVMESRFQNGVPSRRWFRISTTHSRSSATAARISAIAPDPCRAPGGNGSSSQHLGGGVAGHTLEALVYVDERAIREAGVGDGDALGRHVERPVLQGKLIERCSFVEAGREQRRSGVFCRFV